jgi:hypothetical protein
VFIDRNYTEAHRHPPDWTVNSFGQAIDVVLQADGKVLRH